MDAQRGVEEIGGARRDACIRQATGASDGGAERLRLSGEQPALGARSAVGVGRANERAEGCARLVEGAVADVGWGGTEGAQVLAAGPSDWVCGLGEATTAGWLEERAFEADGGVNVEVGAEGRVAGTRGVVAARNAGADVAGTNEPIWASSTISPVCRRTTLLPAMLGPVMTSI